MSGRTPAAGHPINHHVADTNPGPQPARRLTAVSLLYGLLSSYQRLRSLNHTLLITGLNDLGVALAASGERDCGGQVNGARRYAPRTPPAGPLSGRRGHAPRVSRKSAGAHCHESALPGRSDAYD
jgi:hypothetical protein